MKPTLAGLIIFLLAASLSAGVPARQTLDFDGDGKTDYAVVATDPNGPRIWYSLQSTLGFKASAWGALGDVCIPGDYDGDGKWDLAVWRETSTPAVFYVLKSSSNTLLSFPFGSAGDDPIITQDFDGDGKADPAVARNVGGTWIWYIQRSLLGFTAYQFGAAATDQRIRGDFDGDGKADVAVYRDNHGVPANTYFILRSSDQSIQTQAWGNWATDYVISGDFDGDAKTDYAVWRGADPGTNGVWYWLQSTNGAFRSLPFGVGFTDVPAPGDYDGDGKTDQAVWRTEAPETFYVNGSATGFKATRFGLFGRDVILATMNAPLDHQQHLYSAVMIVAFTPMSSEKSLV